MIMSLLLVFVFAAGLWAQENTEISIQVKKDGKVVKDTTYLFDDAKDAKQVLNMVEAMSGFNEDMVFISRDGDKTKIKKVHGDSLVWVSEGKESHAEHVQGENIVILKKGSGETFDIWVDEDDSMEGKKRIKVVVSGDDQGSWTAVSSDEVDLDEDQKVYVISEDEDVQIKVLEIVEDESGDGEEVQVKVIKKKVKKEK